MKIKDRIEALATFCRVCVCFRADFLGTFGIQCILNKIPAYIHLYV